MPTQLLSAYRGGLGAGAWSPHPGPSAMPQVRGLWGGHVLGVYFFARCLQGFACGTRLFVVGDVVTDDSAASVAQFASEAGVG